MTQTLYIIDGHAQIFAAYFAQLGTQLTSPAGEPTKATYVFTNMLLKLIADQKPDKLVVALDAPGPTFRHDIYADYKANRPEAPEDLPVQIARIKQILGAMNIATFSKEGFEADDLIGTISRQASSKGYRVFICSRDKDLEQLIDDQVVDVMALSGDTSDNIPGVPGVGPGFAQKWIQQFGKSRPFRQHPAQKNRTHPHHPSYIHTLREIGYKFIDPDTP